MKHVILLAALALMAGLLPACASSPRPEEPSNIPEILKLPAELSAVLSESTEWELLAIDPERPGSDESPADAFHGFRVQGRKSLRSDLDRSQLAYALNAGIAGNQGMVAGCFLPRHGISAKTEAGRVDLLICFQCMQINVYGEGDDRLDQILTTPDPRRVFDRVYNSAGLTIAK